MNLRVSVVKDGVRGSELGHYVVGRRSQTGVQMPALQHQVIAGGVIESVAGGGSQVVTYKVGGQLSGCCMRFPDFRNSMNGSYDVPRLNSG